MALLPRYSSVVAVCLRVSDGMDRALTLVLRLGTSRKGRYRQWQTNRDGMWRLLKSLNPASRFLPLRAVKSETRINSSSFGCLQRFLVISGAANCVAKLRRIPT